MSKASLKLALIQGKKLSAIRELNDTDYSLFNKAQKILNDFSKDQQLFNMVILNYEDFIKLLNNYYSRLTNNSLSKDVMTEAIVMNINRCILNILSMMRTFLDHTEYRLKRKEGANSNRFVYFKKICSKEYEISFSYRFLYKLRNYAQHCGMPMGDIEISSEIINMETKESSHNLKIYFKRDELLNNFKGWGNNIKEHLEKMPDKFSIIPHIHSMMGSIRNINYCLAKMDLKSLNEAVNTLESFINEIGNKNGIPCIINIENIGKERLNMDIKEFPFHIIRAIKSLND